MNNKNRAAIAKLTLKLIEKYDWEFITLDIIYKNNKIQNTIKNKQELLVNIIKYFDDLLIKDYEKIDNSNSRDMIFETFMLRFDLLNTHRNSIIKIFKLFKKKPQIFIYLLPTFIESIKIIASSSKIKTKYLFDHIKIKALLIIYFSTFFTWMNDKTSSLDKTMNVLDNYLNRVQKIIKL